jgi:ribosome-associated protein
MARHPSRPAQRTSMLFVNDQIAIPLEEFRIDFARSGGPGGQNVNKVASKVELRIDLARIEGLRADARARLDALSASRRDADGWLVVTSQRTRDQHRNLEDAREKVKDLVSRALPAPRKRRATRATKGSVEARLRGKKRDAVVKNLRGSYRGGD